MEFHKVVSHERVVSLEGSLLRQVQLYIILILTLCLLQTELEECTETLSEMIARPYLRTKRSKIIQTAHLVARKRHEFVSAIAKGLIPPDTSPTLKKKRKKFSVELDVSTYLPG